MTNTFYPSTLTHGASFDTDPVPNKLGTQFAVSAATDLTGVYVWSPVDQASGCTVELWAEATMVVEKSIAIVAGDNFVPFDTAQALSTGVNYQVGFSKATDAPFGYSALGSALSAEITDGVFVFPANAGRFTNGAGSAHYMNETSASWYGVSPYIESAPPLSVTATSPVAGVAGTELALSAAAMNAVGDVTWAWTQTSGATQTLADGDTATPSLTPSAAGTYVFRATATDDNGSAHADVTVVASEPAVVPETLWVQDTEGEWHSFTSGDSGGVHAEPWVFYPEDFGAVGDGTTDDTDAINACIAAAAAAAPSNNYSATVKFRSRVYCIAGVPTIGQNYGNSQITLPHVPGSTSPKIILTLKGASDNAPFLYWAQTSPVRGGTTLKSTLADPVSDPDFGTPSVVGGPTNLDAAPQDAMATFSNMLVVLDGVQVQLPHYAAIGGFNLKRIAQVYVKSASVFSDLTLTTTPPISQLPPDDDSYGIIMPDNGNNARNQVDAFTAEGVAVGMIGGEHLIATFLGFVYCRYGLGVAGNSGTKTDGSEWPKAHSYWVGHLLAEGVEHWVYNINGAAQLVIDVLDGEGIVNFTDHINDPNSNLFGRVNLNDINQEVPVVTGGSNLRVVSDGQQLGPRTAPDVPSSTVALKNPFWRDATVVVSGGTVTKIEVNGVDQHVTAGPIVLPTGASIKLTYSSAPAWAWNLS